jgi:WD40 repeat protein
MYLSENYQTLIFNNIEAKQLTNNIHNKSLLVSMISYIKRSEAQKPPFAKQKIIGFHEGVSKLLQIDYKTLATVSGKKIKLWDIYRCNLLTQLLGHCREITSLIYFNNRLISGSYDCALIVWNLSEKLGTIYKLIKFDNSLISLKILKNKKLFITHSGTECVIYNNDYEKVKSINISLKSILTTGQFIIWQLLDNIKIYNFTENSTAIDLLDKPVELVCDPILFDNETIVVVTIENDITLCKINGYQRQLKVKKSYSFIQKLTTKSLAAVTELRMMDIYSVKDYTLNLTRSIEMIFFIGKLLYPLTDGRVVASASRDVTASTRRYPESDLKIIDLMSFEEIMLEENFGSVCSVLQLKDGSVITSNGRYIVKWH